MFFYITPFQACWAGPIDSRGCVYFGACIYMLCAKVRTTRVFAQGYTLAFFLFNSFSVPSPRAMARLYVSKARHETGFYQGVFL